MTPALDVLLDRISQMGRSLPRNSLRRLAGELRKVDGPEAARRIDAPTSVARGLLGELVRAWEQVREVQPATLALALEAANRSGMDAERTQNLELLWSGPGSGTLPVRRTDQSLEGVIARAQSQLLILSFVVFDVPSVVRELRRAVERGVDVRLILEFEGGSREDRVMDPLEALGEIPDEIRVFHWPYESRPEIGSGGKRGYIHVKCAAADRDTALITSANLTRYGMRANMEMGVLVRGGRVPERIFEHFDALIRQEILQPYDRGSHPSRTQSHE